ncbi:MAG: MFS transporter [Actinomycetia bacterium]|nr:MFS transporter [Actinomycetes bacterium]
MVTPQGAEPKHPGGGIFWDPAEHNGEGHPRRWAILGVLLVSLLIVVLDNTVLNIALPTIQRDLAATPGELVWAVDAYILAFAALLFTWGVLGDKYGRRRILLIGLTLFAIASAICAFSVNTHMLIGFRAVMGVGGAAVLPVTLAIITVVFPREERGKAIGIWAGAVGGAVALGPVLGGLLLQHPEWSEWLTGNAWGSVFLINVPIIAVGIFGIIRVVPETQNPNPKRLDVGGLFVSAVGLFLLVFGIIHASEAGTWIDPLVLGPVVAGVGILTVFVLMEARSDHPSFDVSLFGNRGFAVSLAAVSLAFFALSGIMFTLPFFLQVLRGFDTLQAGLCFIPFAVGQLLAAPRSAKVVGRFGYRPVMTIGLVAVGGACLGIAAMDVETPLWMILTVFFAFGFGMGNVMAPASTLIQNSLPLPQAGAGSAVQNTVRQVGGALGVAVIGTLLATTYAAAANETLADLPDQARVTASTSIVATDVVLDAEIDAGLPADQAEALRAAAYQDFLDATQLTSLISAGIVALAALIVILFLPAITPPEQLKQKAATDPGP